MPAPPTMTNTTSGLPVTSKLDPTTKLALNHNGTAVNKAGKLANNLHFSTRLPSFQHAAHGHVTQISATPNPTDAVGMDVWWGEMRSSQFHYTCGMRNTFFQNTHE